MYCQGEEGTWTGGGSFQNNNTLTMKPYRVKFNKLTNINIVDPSPHGNPSVGVGGKEERVLTYQQTSYTHTNILNDTKTKITTKDGKLFVNDVLAMDFNDDTFIAVKAPY